RPMAAVHEERAADGRRFPLVSAAELALRLAPTTGPISRSSVPRRRQLSRNRRREPNPRLSIASLWRLQIPSTLHIDSRYTPRNEANPQPDLRPLRVCPDLTQPQYPIQDGTGIAYDWVQSDRRHPQLRSSRRMSMRPLAIAPRPTLIVAIPHAVRHPSNP